MKWESKNLYIVFQLYESFLKVNDESKNNTVIVIVNPVFWPITVKYYYSKYIYQG